MASVNKNFAVEKGLEVGDSALFVDADNNKTGVGKTDAQYTLDVSGTANFDGTLAAGSIGIGSTQPVRNLDVNGTARFSDEVYDLNDSSGTTGQVLQAVTGTGVSWTDIADIQVNAAGTDFQIQYKRTDAKLGGANQLYYNDTTNRVGIGTSAPEYLLQIARPRDDSSNGFVQIGGTFLDSNATVGLARSVLSVDSGGETIWIKVPAEGLTGDIQFRDAEGTLGPTTNFVYDSLNERVGIGTTQPEYKLEVKGTVGIAGTFYDVNDTVGVAGSVLGVDDSGNLRWVVSGAAGTTGQVQFMAEGGSTEGAGQVYYNQSNDRLGIGVSGTDINYLLHVGRPTDRPDNGFVQIGGTFLDSKGSIGSASSILGVDDNGETIWIKVPAEGLTGDIQFRDAEGRLGPTTNFVYDSENERVGIGTTQPEYTLQVGVGNTVQFLGNLRDSNDTVGAANSALHADATGNVVWSSSVSAPPEKNVIFVCEDGDDANSGETVLAAKRTIGAACAIATTGEVIRVTTGVYTENNPVDIPKNVTIDGDDLRNTQVIPQNIGEDLFYVDNGVLVQNLSFIGAANTGSMIAFNPDATTGIITQSPYVRNCTNFVPDSIGMKIDGNHAEGLKSMVVDSYTQYNQGGIGVSITNNGYAQLVSIFTICDKVAIYCGSGGQCDLTNSNSSFGDRGLVASGVGTVTYTGTLSTAAEADDNTVVVSGLGNERPFTGQVFYIGELFNQVNSITVTSAGSGYTSSNPPTVTIGSPSGPDGITAEGIAVVSGFGSITSVDLISNGSQYRSAPTVTIADPSSGETATATATISPLYFTINSATPPSAGISTITIDQNLPSNIGVGSTVPFAKQSLILASSHSFEYVGSGMTMNQALPQNGGVAIPENSVVSEDGGIVVHTSTDEKGNFKIGNDFVINQQTGTVTGASFNKSIQATLTPLIIALGQ